VDPDEVAATIARYDARLSEYGATEKALGWGEKGRSRIRFHVLASRWNLTGARILDFGCGFGDFLGYLQAAGVRPAAYTGIDVNESLVAIARERYPDGAFVCGDMLAGHTFAPDAFDYAVSSGVFNFKLRDNAGFIEKAFAEFHRIAARGFAGNFLSDRVEYKLDDTYHADPAAILSLGLRYSNNVVLRNDYMPYEFTLFVDTGARVDETLTVYEDYVAYR